MESTAALPPLQLGSASEAVSFDSEPLSEGGQGIGAADTHERVGDLSAHGERFDAGGSRMAPRLPRRDTNMGVGGLDAGGEWFEGRSSRFGERLDDAPAMDIEYRQGRQERGRAPNRAADGSLEIFTQPRKALDLRMSFEGFQPRKFQGLGRRRITPLPNP